MAFGIPLSKTNPLEDNPYNQYISLNDYVFLHKNSKYRLPMRAIINQSSRIDANVLNKNRHIGRLTDETVKNKIRNKLFEWLFSGD